ncbi:MAG: hypothetical protein ACI8RD_006826 [Bacillariaceae sp.]
MYLHGESGKEREERKEGKDKDYIRDKSLFVTSSSLSSLSYTALSV